MQFELSVNGKRLAVECEHKTPLLWVLRNNLNLTGTRFGCGSGLCGACTVLLNGVPVQACDTPIWSVGKKSVQTIENQDNKVLNSVKSCIESAQAGQCGFCLSGIMMRATSIIESKNSLSRVSVAAALDGHLCRCGAHNRIITAILDAGEKS